MQNAARGYVSVWLGKRRRGLQGSAEEASALGAAVADVAPRREVAEVAPSRSEEGAMKGEPAVPKRGTQKQVLIRGFCL